MVVCNKILYKSCNYLVIAFGEDIFKDDPNHSNLGGFKLELENYKEMEKQLIKLGLPIMVT